MINELPAVAFVADPRLEAALDRLTNTISKGKGV
jgi:hypothetical protein